MPARHRPGVLPLALLAGGSRIRAPALLLALLSAACASRQSAYDERHRLRDPRATSVQALIGAALYDDLSFERSDPGDPDNSAVVDLSQTPLLGLAGQYRLTGDQSFEAGFDGALIFSWWDARSETLATGGGTAVIVISREILFTDLSFGGFVATVLGDWLRVYAGAGPLMLFANGEFGDENGSESESGFGLGGYVRAGAELRIDENSFLGFGGRAVWSEVDFGGTAEDLDADSIQLMLTFTQDW
jgi:hypothetical protein